MLSTKGYIRFLRDGTEFGHEVVRSRFGYLCVQGMVFGREAQVDPATGEVLSTGRPVIPSHYKSPANGLCMELDDPSDWPNPEDDHA